MDRAVDVAQTDARAALTEPAFEVATDVLALAHGQVEVVAYLPVYRARAQGRVRVRWNRDDERAVDRGERDRARIVQAVERRFEATVDDREVDSAGEAARHNSTVYGRGVHGACDALDCQPAVDEAYVFEPRAARDCERVLDARRVLVTLVVVARPVVVRVLGLDVYGTRPGLDVYLRLAQTLLRVRALDGVNLDLVSIPRRDPHVAVDVRQAHAPVRVERVGLVKLLRQLRTRRRLRARCVRRRQRERRQHDQAQHQTFTNHLLSSFFSLRPLRPLCALCG